MSEKLSNDSYPYFYVCFWEVNPFDEEKHKCKICSVGSSNKYITCKGNNKGITSNLGAHMRQVHKDQWQSECTNYVGELKPSADEPGQTSLSDLGFVSKVSPKAKNLHAWMEWVVMEDHPFSFVESVFARRYSKLEPISVNTLKKYIELVGLRVKDKIKKILPENFSGVHDGNFFVLLLIQSFGSLSANSDSLGWTLEGKAMHFFAFFASWTDAKGVVRRALLSCAPMGDETAFTAQRHAAAIEDVLGDYDRTRSALQCFSSDSCPTNQACANLMNIVQVGCGNHRLALATKVVTDSEEPLLVKVSFRLSICELT